MRVVECGSFASAYAGRLFADRGADVIKLERPGGDCAREAFPKNFDVGSHKISTSFAFFHINKRFITLDLNSPPGVRLLQALAGQLDLLLVDEPYSTTFHADGTFRRLLGEHPHLVIVAITPFGLEGPYAGFQSDDLVLLGMSGLLGPAGSPSGGPTRFPGHMVDVLVGLSAASSGSLALAEVESGGGGRVVDVSKEAVLASLTTVAPAVPKYLQEGFMGYRGKSTPGVPSVYYPTKDGTVKLTVHVEWMWPILAQWISEVTGETEVLSPQFEGVGRSRYGELVDHWITELTQQFTTEELLAEAQLRKITVAPLNDLKDVLANPQLEARGYLREESWMPQGIRFPGPAYKTEPDQFGAWRPLKAAGGDNREVYTQLAGLSESRIGELSREGVL